jgi:endo-1,4-beta-mannosidase
MSNPETAGHFFTGADGRPVFWIGTNYWPAHAALRMWSDWRPDLMAEELHRMKELGFNVHRSFLFLPDFIPDGHRVEPVMLDRFREFLELCRQAGIGTIPTLFVGHMSGEDWDVAWRRNGNFYTDPELRRIQHVYVESIVRAAQDIPAVWGWLLSNEIFNYEPDGTPEEVTAWIADMTDCIRALDDRRPISTGEGARGPEINRRLVNFQLRRYHHYVDFIGFHFYPATQNPWHQSFTAAFRINLARSWGKPAIVEEFGHSTVMGTEKNQAHYYRTVLYSAAVNGAQGALNWCFTDFDQEEERPYIHHPFELRFGLVTTDGRLRPAGQVMRDFAAWIQDLTAADWRPVTPPEIGLTIPSNYYYTYPHDPDADFTQWYPLYLEIFSQLKRSNLTPRVVLEPAVELERDGQLSHDLLLDPRDLPILLLPRLKRLTTRLWRQVREYVRAGGVVYASFAYNHWLPDWEEFFGIESDLKFGIPEYRQWETLQVLPTRSWGVVDTRQRLEIPLTAGQAEWAYCPVRKVHGEVLWTDQSGHPLLVHRSLGKGHVYFSVYPLEMFGLAAPGDRADRLLQGLYRSLWQEHGAPAAIRLHGADLELGVWYQPNQDQLKLAIVNHAWEARRGELEFPAAVQAGRLPEGVTISATNRLQVDLPCKEVVTLHVQVQAFRGNDAAERTSRRDDHVAITP